MGLNNKFCLLDKPGKIFIVYNVRVWILNFFTYWAAAASIWKMISFQFWHWNMFRLKSPCGVRPINFLCHFTYPTNWLISHSFNQRLNRSDKILSFGMLQFYDFIFINKSFTEVEACLENSYLKSNHFVLFHEFCFRPLKGLIKTNKHTMSKIRMSWK